MCSAVNWNIWLMKKPIKCKVVSDACPTDAIGTRRLIVHPISEKNWHSVRVNIWAAPAMHRLTRHFRYDDPNARHRVIVRGSDHSSVVKNDDGCVAGRECDLRLPDQGAIE